MSSTIQQSQVVRPKQPSKLRRAEVLASLRMLGADEYDILLPETKYLAQLLREHEVMLSVVYGKYTKTTLPHIGRGLFVITNRRVLLVNKKPLFLQYDEIKFEMISGVQYGKTLLAETVTLDTRMGNIVFRTFNDHCAQNFVHVVEDIFFDRDKGRQFN